jgi:hypothetical protein
MSSNDPTAPIPPARFAAALTELPLSSLALKAAEIRNSIAHLEYSNAQLLPFAEGTEGPDGSPDQDCVEAIQENEIVIERMKERILLLKAEVEKRGVSWREFAGAEEMVDDEGETIKINGTRNAAHANTNGDAEVNGTGPATNGTTETPERHSAWSDGTFTVGRISGGEVVMEQDGAGSGVVASSSRGQGQQGGRLGDEELRRMMDERMRAAMADDDDEGMHL